MDAPLLTARQVAQALNIQVVTVYAAAAAGKIPHVRLWAGKRRALIRFKAEDIEGLVRDRSVDVGRDSA